MGECQRNGTAIGDRCGIGMVFASLTGLKSDFHLVRMITSPTRDWPFLEQTMTGSCR